MKVLVTGATGYIGSHTVVELQMQKHEVLIIDNLSNSDKKVVDAIEKITGIRPQFFQIDLCDKNSLQKFFDENKPEAVIHFAAYKAVGESVEQPLKYYQNNLTGLMNLLEMMQEKNIFNFVFSSSCSVYGDADHLPISEDAPLKKAVSPYGNTKRICEEILFDAAQSFPFQIISLRYFNPAGAHASILIGETPVGAPNNLVPVITQTAAGRRDQLIVHGNDYETPDGTCIRDYIHVVDLAKAHIKAIDYLHEKKNKSNFEIFNLGTGKGNSVMEVIKTFEEVSGKKLNYKIGPRRAGDVIQVWADAAKANSELGWKAEMGLKEILSSAWMWELALGLEVQ